MATSYGAPVIWGLIVAIGVLTFAIRLSFIALFGYVEEIPAGLQRALRYVPPAVLGALVLPALLGGVGTGTPAVDKLTAGVAAAGVAWRTENVLATMVAGMGVLWLLRFVVLPAV